MLQIPDVQGFHNFLKTGKLGPIDVNSTHEEIIEYLGKPVFSQSKYHEQNQQNVLSLDYGNLLFTFIDEELTMVVIYVRDIDDPRRKIFLPPSINIEWYPAIEKFNRRSFREFLENASLKFISLEHLAVGEENLFRVLPSRMNIYFEENGSKIYNIIITNDV